MSLDPETAMLRAVRTRLRANMTLADSECDVEDDGLPPPVWRTRYLAIQPAQFENRREADLSLTIRIGLDVVVYVRVPFIGETKSRDLLADKIGITALCFSVIQAVHNDYANVMNVANASLAAGQAFVEPLQFEGVSAPRRVSGAELFADTENPEKNAAMVRTVRFRNAGL